MLRGAVPDRIRSRGPRPDRKRSGGRVHDPRVRRAQLGGVRPSERPGGASVANRQRDRDSRDQLHLHAPARPGRRQRDSGALDLGVEEVRLLRHRRELLQELDTAPAID